MLHPFLPTPTIVPDYPSEPALRSQRRWEKRTWMIVKRVVESVLE
jgi:hypothetical protein